MNKIKFLSGATVLTLLLVVSQVAWADTLVSTIDGNYNITSYDTPALLISNTTGFDFTNAQMVLTGYNGVNNGLSQTVALGTIAATTVDTLIWGPGPGPFYIYDYDDSKPDPTTYPCSSIPDY